MSLTQEELVDMIFVLGECERNPLLASRIYAQRYPERRHPQNASFRTVLERFVTTGSVQKKKRNRNSIVATEEREFHVVALLQENPHRSIREISKTVEISATSVYRIVKKHKYHPYHIQLHQELLDIDFQRRQEFCEWAMQMINEDQHFFRHVLFTDESTFHKNGFVNRHNFHYYATENPHYLRESHSQNRWSVNVWGGVFGDRVVGPVFLNNTLNGMIYEEFLRNELMNILDNFPLAILPRMWLQHDGAPPHNFQGARNFLNEQYPNKWIGRGGPISWPARSPDLTKCDFFLWGFVKDKVYSSPPTTINDMKNRITQAFRDISPEMLANVDECFKKRIRLCAHHNGRHFEHLV